MYFLDPPRGLGFASSESWDLPGRLMSVVVFEVGDLGSGLGCTAHPRHKSGRVAGMPGECLEAYPAGAETLKKWRGRCASAT